MNLQEISDKLEIQELIDNLSISSDELNPEKQVADFTDDATFRVINEGQKVAEITGKDAIYKAFSDTGITFKSVYHLNGQSVIKLSGNSASSITYNQVTWTGIQDDKETGMIQNAKYLCKFKKINGLWKIQELENNFILNLPLNK
ncbi:nuclear transport factor 2 family protein [Companilactobacillus baiquanensis]|uniref:Nuclear transport factor 2 family protein n=1 Tax=Companilactobacillus baiquanensis TaxID=2486005 RepID=A0ABW1UUX4_9LACO|nr:nuclear transport factor 2 family protein [Companilactobacillus baiquanensis]